MQTFRSRTKLFPLVVIVIILAAATAVLAGTAWYSSGGSLGLNPPRGVSHHAPADLNRALTFHSASMDVDVGVIVYTPPGYDSNDTDTRYPVIYFLHGGQGNEWNYLSTFSRNAPSGSSIYDPNGNPNLLAFIESGLVPPAIVVMPNGGAASGFLDNPPVLSETMIITELIPFIDANYNTVPLGGWRAIEGNSMGGYGALNFAFEHSELFCGVLVYGPGVGIPGEDTPFDEVEYVRRVQANEAEIKANGLQIRSVIADFGEPSPIRPYQEQLSVLMTDLGIAHELIILTEPEVGHNLVTKYRATLPNGDNAGLDNAMFLTGCLYDSEPPPPPYPTPEPPVVPIPNPTPSPTPMPTPNPTTLTEHVYLPHVANGN